MLTLLPTNISLVCTLDVDTDLIPQLDVRNSRNKLLLEAFDVVEDFVLSWQKDRVDPLII